MSKIAIGLNTVSMMSQSIAANFSELNFPDLSALQGRDLFNGLAQFGLRRKDLIGSKSNEMHQDEWLETAHHLAMTNLFRLGADELPHLHRAASHGLLIETSRHSIPDIRDALQSPSSRVRLMAITVLRMFLDDSPNMEQSELLIAGLQDIDADVRRETMRCLMADSSRLENLEIIKRVSELVEDSDDTIKEIARDLIRFCTEDEDKTYTTYQRRTSQLQEKRLHQVREKLESEFPKTWDGIPLGEICIDRDKFSFSLTP